MSLARFIKQRLSLLTMPKFPEPLMTIEQILADPPLAMVAEKITNLGLLPRDEQARVYKTVMDNGLSYGDLRIIHNILQTSAYSDSNALKGYVWHRDDANRLGKPARDEEVVLREHVKSLGPKAMVRHCKKRTDLKVAFGEIFGKQEAIKAFGRDYENTIDMDM